MNILLINDSPFINLPQSRYCMNLINYLHKKHNIILYISSIYKDDDNLDKPFCLISYNEIKSFFRNFNINSEQEKVFSKIKYILKTQSGLINENILNEFVKNLKINYIIFLSSITSMLEKEYKYKDKNILNGFEINEKINCPIIMNIRSYFSNMSDFEINNLNYADILLFNTKYFYELSEKNQKISNKPKLFIPNYIDTKEEPLNLIEKRILRKKLNLPLTSNIFFVDIPINHSDENHRTLFDVYIRLFKKFYMEYDDNSYLIINMTDENRLLQILELEEIDNYKVLIEKNFYRDSNIEYNEKIRKELIFSSDFIINLSGGEEFFEVGLLAQSEGIPVFYNYTSGLREQLLLGEFNYDFIDVLVPGGQAFINLPIMKKLYDNFINFFEKYKKHDRVKWCKENKNLIDKFLEKYNKDYFEKSWDRVLNTN